MWSFNFRIGDFSSYASHLFSMMSTSFRNVKIWFNCCCKRMFFLVFKFKQQHYQVLIYTRWNDYGKRITCGVCVCVSFYLCEGAHDRALHDASEEYEINIFGSWAWWQVFEVVQYLLHCWRENKWVNRTHWLVLYLFFTWVNALWMQPDKLVTKLSQLKVN